MATNLNHPKILILIGTIILFGLLVLYKNQPTQVPNKNEETQSLDFRAEQKKWIQEFVDLGNKYGTDKIYHGYHDIYGTYLGPIKQQKLNILEIGLGCTMRYGPGKSLLVWKEYLPNADLSVLEYDAKCAEQFRNKVKNLYIGDQSDFNLLNEAGKTGPYDMIIDDGGHSRKQQVNSLFGLFPYLKSGGVYVLEDLYFSFVKEVNDRSESAYEVIVKLIKLFNKVQHQGETWIDNDYSNDENILKLHSMLVSINCFKHGCVLIKK